MRSQVDNIDPQLMLEVSTKTANFNTGVFAVNNNRNIALTLHLSSPSGLTGSAKVQGSFDQVTWIDLDSTEVLLSDSLDDALWTISSVHSLTYLRIAAVITSGSANFMALARGT